MPNQIHMQTIFYITSHYIGLLSFILSCWGYGQLVKNFTNAKNEKASSLEDGIFTIIGLGIFICAFQILSIAHQFKSTQISIVIFAGILLSAFYYIRPKDTEDVLSGFKLSNLSVEQKLGLAIVFIVALATLLKPLRVPLSWDEVMYHLPHAKSWAQAGTITINESFRYPWFPSNFELLYAAAISIFDDIMPHMLHALSGWLIAFILYAFSIKHLNFRIAVLSSLIWLVVSRNDYDNANIDLGITLFIFAGTVAFYLWLENRHKFYWLVISSFLMGLAAGTKYQALMFLPVFFITAIFLERNWKKLAILTLVFLTPCIYWYLRNFLLTGDPVSPMGGNFFGFFDWNQSDFKHQFKALENKKGWPTPFFLIGLVVLMTPNFKYSLLKKAAVIFVSYAFIIWLIVSHYTRYLLPIYPILALLAACSIDYLIDKTKQLITNFFPNLNYQKFNLAILSCVMVLVFIDSSIRAYGAYKYITPDMQTREEFLLKKFSGYDLIKRLNTNIKGKTYQFGLEDYIYYIEVEVWGDHFGPGRYRDFEKLSSKELHTKLKSLGFENLLINVERYKNIDSKKSFECYFTFIGKSKNIRLYTIQKSDINCI
jgi:hypothetical protein